MAARGTAVLASCAFAFVQLQMLLPTFHLVQPGGKSLLLYPQSWNPQDHPKRHQGTLDRELFFLVFSWSNNLIQVVTGIYYNRRI